MLDMQLLTRDFAQFTALLARRGLAQQSLAPLAALAQARLTAVQKLQALRQQQNEATQALAQQVRQKNMAAVTEAKEALRQHKAAIQAAEAEEGAAAAALEEALLQVPNLPEPEVPAGKDEQDNVERRRHGTPSSFAFAAKAHWQLAEELGLADFARAAKMSGPRFAVLLGQGAALERALAAFMLDHAKKHGFVEVSPPLLVRPESMQAAGQYPKFKGESFETDGHVLIPTSEVSLVNLHREEVLATEQLPLRYTAYTPCFRREAGAAGRDTRGLIRQHQFYKVELVSLCTSDTSAAEHAHLLACAAGVLEALALPYRVMDLCGGDLGFAAQRTYDLEVWLPGQQAYREISSCSNCGDFQARRAAIRHRPGAQAGKQKPQLVHTLNGSSLAVGRTLVAVLENYQQQDGTVRVPPALVPYLGGRTVLDGKNA